MSPGCSGDQIPGECVVPDPDDYRGDGLLHLNDVTALADCLTGVNRASAASAAGCVGDSFTTFDFDEDGDVDPSDRAEFGEPGRTTRLDFFDEDHSYYVR